MEQETGAAAKGKDSNDDQNAPDPSSLTGKKEDQDQQDIIYMKKKWARLSSGQEITPIKQSAEHEFGAKTEKLRDDSQKLKQTTEDMAKEKEEKRELEKLNEDLRKPLETNESWSFGEVCRPKEISTQRSPDAAPEVEELYKRTASDEERFPTQALSASTSSDAKGRGMSEEVSKPQPLFHSPRRTLPTLETLHAEWRRMSKEVSEPQPLFHSPRRTFPTLETLHAELRRMSKKFPEPQPLFHSPRRTLPTLETLHLEPTPATGCIDVSTIPVKSDKDRRLCYITGMAAISETQLMLADESNNCIKLVDLERETVIGVKVLPSAPHDVTCVPSYRVAVTIPAFNEIHVFIADRYLQQCKIMHVDGICLGIHYIGGAFIVSCKHPPLVKILDMHGDIIKTIQLAPIEYPMYLTCSPDYKLYVSDVYNDTVTCMDMVGSVQWRYNCKHSQSAGLTFPQGVCTGDGCIYICSFDEIHVVSPTGTKLAIIPFRMTGAKNAAVCYNSQDRTLYVSPFPSVTEKNTHIIRIRMQ